MTKNIIVVLASLLLIGQATFATPSFAFKGNTHIWVAQEVLNDVIDNGKVTITPYGEFSVIPEVVTALRDHPNEYRMGSIGPDGFPDLIGAQMTVHPGRYSLGGWRTDDWLKKLVNAAGTNRERSFVYGYMTHAATDVFSHSYVNLYAGDAYILSDGIEEEARHMALEGFIKEHQPPLVDATGNYIGLPRDVVEPANGNNSAAPAAFLRDTLILDHDAAEQYRADPISQYLALMHDFWEVQGNVIAKIKDAKTDIEAKIQQVEDELYDLKHITVSIWGKEVRLWPYYCFVDPGTCSLIESTEHLLLPIAEEAAEAAVSGIQVPMEAWRGQVEEALKQYVITSDKVAREVVTDHTGAAGEESVQGHLQEWTCNWAPVFAGVPHVVVLPGCTANRYVQDVMDGIAVAREKISEKLGYLGWLVDPMQKVDELVDAELKPRFKDFAEDIGDRLIGSGSPIMSAARLALKSQGTAEGLNNEFAADPSNKGLLLIPDAATRVAAEMHLTAYSPFPGEYFSKTEYAVAYNSVILSKLALLPPNELSRLTRDVATSKFHVFHTLYNFSEQNPGIPLLPLGPSSPLTASGTGLPGDTSPVYTGTPLTTNILFDAVASLDGSHQWQETAPAYPRREGYSDTSYPNNRNYGYKFPQGLKYWQDCELRDKVFLKIFKGPLAPGLEAPGLLNLEELSADLNGTPNFPNRATIDNPFPLSNASYLPIKIRPSDLFSWGLSFTPASVKDLVVELDSQACGGSAATPLTYEWSFVDECSYICSESAENTISCHSDTCVNIPDLAAYSQEFRYCNYQRSVDPTTGNIRLYSTNTHCPSIRAVRDGSLYNATFNAAKITATQEGDCLNYQGMRICDTDAQSTNLLMVSDKTQEIQVKVHDPITGRSKSTRTTITALPSPYVNYLTAEDIINYILQQNNVHPCNVPFKTLKETADADVVAPIIYIQKKSITTECNPSGQTGGTSVVLGSAYAYDDRDGNVPLSSSAQVPSSFPLGTSQVTYSAVDTAGNRSTDIQHVTVADRTPPSFGSPALPPIVVTATSPTTNRISLTPPSATDSCSSSSEAVTITANPNLSALPLGDTTIIWTATDPAGNRASIRQLVTVKPLKGDINCDGAVNMADAQLLQAAMGSTEGGANYDPFADLDEDKQITLNDYQMMSTLLGIPLAIPQSVTTTEDTAKSITLTAAHRENASLTFSVLTQPTHGTLVGTAPHITYMPAVDYLGTDSFTFKANDGTMDSNIATINIMVNAAPVVAITNGPLIPVPVGNTVNLWAQFSDKETTDSHTATWNWDDGTTSTGTVNENNGSGTVSGTHSYSTAGVYSVTLTVTDNSDARGITTFQYVVVYDPTIGFATGGGWITSLPGAYIPDTALAGKATFGFVSKYTRNTTIPTGETEFQFKVANLNFKSTAYDWLVVAGAKAQYKGVGTINGTGSFRFMLTAIDGALLGGGKQDMFRMKIWGSDAVIYDNQLGATDNADPTTVIGGGSIVIHK